MASLSFSLTGARAAAKSAASSSEVSRRSLRCLDMRAALRSSEVMKGTSAAVSRSHSMASCGSGWVDRSAFLMSSGISRSTLIAVLKKPSRNSFPSVAGRDVSPCNTAQSFASFSSRRCAT